MSAARIVYRSALATMSYMVRASHRDVLRTIIENFQQRSIDLATGGGVRPEEWEEARAELLSRPELLRVLPDWVASTRWGGQFWQLMKSTSRSYAGRREFIWSTLSAAFELAEKGATLPISSSFEPLLRTCTSAAVADAWERIHVRRDSDPEGTITAARSLLESVCKYVLDHF